MEGDPRMISVVMAYYNRKQLLLNTLESIKKFSNDVPYEIIVVDDGSSAEHQLRDIKAIKLVEIPKEKKTWVNSCIPFNVGFKEAKGDIIVIQNPECAHNGSILQYTKDNVNDSNYISFGCYSLPENGDKNIINRVVPVEGQAGWYNNSRFRPVGYHFCSAITKKNLNGLGGFDERFAHGIDYDDNEFLTRIKRKNLDVRIVDEPFVFHQYHYTPGYRPAGCSNRELFNQILKEDKIKANENISN